MIDEDVSRGIASEDSAACKLLWMSVIEAAIKDAMSFTVDKAGNMNTLDGYWSARAWLYSRKKEHFNRFERVCAEIGLDPDAIREAYERRVSSKKSARGAA